MLAAMDIPIDLTDTSGVTALLLAIHLDHVAAAMALMKSGAVLRSKVENGDGTDIRQLSSDEEMIAGVELATAGNWGAVSQLLAQRERRGAIKVKTTAK